MGIVIHPRIGLPENIKFLSDEYLGLMEAAIVEASKQNIEVFLYDEAMYPSGSAHGMVVEGNPEYASRGLKVMEIEFSVTEAINTGNVMKKIMNDCSIENIVSIQIVRKLSGTEIDPDSIAVLQKECDLSDFIFPEHEYLTVLVFIEDFTGGVIRGIHFGEDDNEPGAPLYPDVLNPDACRKFLSIVYETFYRRFGQYFGKTVKAIFTDEPRPLAKRSPSYFKPWTGGFLQYLWNMVLRKSIYHFFGMAEMKGQPLSEENLSELFIKSWLKRSINLYPIGAPLII